MSNVSISLCPSYDDRILEDSLSECLSRLGGIEKFVKPGNKVLLKVNALMGLPPESACPTHPAFVKAVAKQVIKAGGIPVIGDNPGSITADINSVFRTIGYDRVAEELGIEITNLRQTGSVEVPSKINRTVKEFPVSKGVLDADVVINLPKLKTHMLMLYTGAIKNMFGAVPGFHKSRLHFAAPNSNDLAAIFVDIYSAVKPALNIMDAVVSMEGTGPSAGKARKTEMILASADGVALDAVASTIIGYIPLEVPTTRIASEHDIGEARLEKINTFGIDINGLVIRDFEKIRSAFEVTSRIPGWATALSRLFTERIKVFPRIDPGKCTACQTCVKGCPVHCITVEKGKTYNIDRSKCISCFCCHELCTYKAIELKKNLLARLIYR